MARICGEESPLANLDAIQRLAMRIIGDPALTDALDSLGHRRTVSTLSFFIDTTMAFVLTR